MIMQKYSHFTVPVLIPPVAGLMTCSHCTGPGQGMGNNGFLYYTIYCTLHSDNDRDKRTIVTVCKRSCGKMFLHLSVSHSVHRGSASVHAGQTSPRQTTPWTDTHPLGRQPPGQTPAADGHCTGRYASYWNAFLFSIVPIPFPVPFPVPCSLYEPLAMIRQCEYTISF